MRKNNDGDIIHPDFKLYYKTAVIKTALHWCKNRSMKQNREPPNKLTIYGQLIYDKEATNIQ